MESDPLLRQKLKASFRHHVGISSTQRTGVELVPTPGPPRFVPRHSLRCRGRRRGEKCSECCGGGPGLAERHLHNGRSWQDLWTETELVRKPPTRSRTSVRPESSSQSLAADGNANLHVAFVASLGTDACASAAASPGHGGDDPITLSSREAGRRSAMPAIAQRVGRWFI